MAKTKEELGQQIEAIFAETTDVTNLEQAVVARKKLSNKLALVIDQHVQYQLGERLELILGSLRISIDPRTDYTYPEAGPEFDSLIRKS